MSFPSMFNNNSKVASASADCLATREQLVQRLGKSGSVLEIGPFCRPCLHAEKTAYFDIMDADGLRQRAEALGLDKSAVPDIDYVDSEGCLSVIDATFDAVFSAHCIEHQPDLVAHLQQVESILEPGGSYFLLIPDKRYCFDHFIAESTIANIIDAYHEKRTVHRLASIIEHRALTTHNNVARHWQGDHADDGYLNGMPQRAKDALVEYQRANGSYIDVHAWQFTPTSFETICKQINELGYTRMEPTQVCETPEGRVEFTAMLRNNS